ncbi:AAA family ATPase [Paraburkholderia caledonica]
MNPTVICFAGRIGSGKSSVSRSFAERAHWKYVSFGDYVRSVARERGSDAEDRSVLQALGAALIEVHGWQTFCEKVVGHAGWSGNEPLVVDGIRHIEVYTALQKLVAPRRTALAYLDIQESLLQERRLQRQLPNPDSLAETHSTEIQVIQSLPGLADILIDADRPIEEIVADIVTSLGLH